MNQSFHSESKLGCEHYARECFIIPNCCNKKVVCRICHDEQCSDHKIDRHETKLMECMQCGKTQKASQECTNPKCSALIAEYYCDECNICRLGKKEDFTHCTQCNCCFQADYYKNHQCIQNVLGANCAWCDENLFNSRKQVCFMKECGHPIHRECWEVYSSDGLMTGRSIKCIVCCTINSTKIPFTDVVNTASDDDEEIESESEDENDEIVDHFSNLQISDVNLRSILITDHAMERFDERAAADITDIISTKKDLQKEIKKALLDGEYFVQSQSNKQRVKISYNSMTYLRCGFKTRLMIT